MAPTISISEQDMNTASAEHTALMEKTEKAIATARNLLQVAFDTLVHAGVSDVSIRTIFEQSLTTFEENKPKV